MGFRSVCLETCVSFVLDSDALRASSSESSPAKSIRLSSDIFLDLLGHLRELSITCQNLFHDSTILRLVTLPCANVKEVWGLLRVDQLI